MTTMLPLWHTVVAREPETVDTVTLTLRPLDASIPTPAPGQFTMLYAFGVGEVPISVSGTRSGDLDQTLRAVGAVTRALHDCRTGDVVGVRGPFGAGWRLPAPAGRDLLLVAGGIGLAPLRPALDAALRDRSHYRRVTVVVGARTPADLLFTGAVDGWVAAGARVETTVDRATDGWTGRVGVAPAVLDDVPIDPATTTALVCGPEVMMRFTAAALRRHGVPAADVQVSLERNMRCGVAWCGHCQLGPLLLCRDGPVVGYDRAAPLLAVKEL
ncbi:FAD/NAD(P)-binding protein [Virgisporangium ochraceum]|uniref:Oxidoreductase n=1 Tax=Virgisporangium ochraceum TaxID=65505 RepID=A0A8J3ZWB0_9ACTN|nr:FAD/NAD(P)-binding protein [Virgisporangium ochraceum]GIJ71554.1 oxidoreductase [Virgisporangium ochraceum]